MTPDPRLRGNERSSGATGGRLPRRFGVSPAAAARGAPAPFTVPECRAGQPGEHGAGTVLAVCVVTLVLAATAVALGWVGALVARQRADAAADLAVLAAAAESMRGSDGCAAAARVASAMNARVVSCRVSSDGTVDVLTEVDLPVLSRPGALVARGRARAGPLAITATAGRLAPGA